MASIFSVQNLHTFLRRKNFRPPSRPPGPPGRGPRPPPRSPPRSPPPPDLSPPDALTSSAIILRHDSNFKTTRHLKRWRLELPLLPLLVLALGLALLPPVPLASLKSCASHRAAS